MPSAPPTTYTPPDESAETPVAETLPDVPNCRVHSSSPSELYLRMNESLPPTFVSPGNSPFVLPTTYTPPDESPETSIAVSNSDVPNCRVHSSSPSELYLRTNASNSPPSPV